MEELSWHAASRGSLAAGPLQKLRINVKHDDDVSSFERWLAHWFFHLLMNQL